MTDQIETTPEEQDYPLVVGFMVKNVSEEAAIAELEAWFAARGITDAQISVATFEDEDDEEWHGI